MLKKISIMAHNFLLTHNETIPLRPSDRQVLILIFWFWPVSFSCWGVLITLTRLLKVYLTEYLRNWNEVSLSVKNDSKGQRSEMFFLPRYIISCIFKTRLRWRWLFYHSNFSYQKMRIYYYYWKGWIVIGQSDWNIKNRISSYLKKVPKQTNFKIHV